MSEHCDITPAEERTWDAATLAFRLLDQRVEQDVQREVDLPLTYYELLVLLSKADHGSLRMSDLAELTHTRASRISHAVRKLAEAGLVERVHCESDRRSWFAVLTDRGRKVLEQAGGRHVESMRENLFDVLSPEQRDHLLDISRTLLAGLAPGSALAAALAPAHAGDGEEAVEGSAGAGDRAAEGVRAAGVQAEAARAGAPGSPGTPADSSDSSRRISR